jgi:lysophospholipase L1-like esterase
VNPLLVPIVAVQGMWMRSTIEMASPAAGPTSGTVGDPSRSPVRIAVVGESTAAGCGVDTHNDGFAGCLARELAQRIRRPVTWEVVGQHGATARRIRYRFLPQLEENLDGQRLDLAVLLAGGNDVLSRRTPDEWGADLAAIVDDLAARAGRVAVAGTPPFAAFPALPATLGRYLAERGSALDAVSQQICAQRPQAIWISSTAGVPPPDSFAPDRFHPSAAGYRRWAQDVAPHIAHLVAQDGRRPRDA